MSLNKLLSQPQKFSADLIRKDEANQPRDMPKWSCMNFGMG